MPEITPFDRALLLRAARFYAERAKWEMQTYAEEWATTTTGRESKRRHDRYLREERDLRSLVKRLEVTA